MNISVARVLLAMVVLAGSTMSGSAVNIDMVTVGDPGNAADITGYGAVADEFRIGKYEVTIGQYCEFLNAAAKSDPYSLYKSTMATDLNIAGISRSGLSGSYTYSVIGPYGYNPSGASSPGNRPITYISWWDAGRFANWMHNGQGSGSTETGAYTLNGAISGNAPAVNPAAQFYIPTENQWYKAAYYKGGGSDTGYWKYPTQNDKAPRNTIGVDANGANYHSGRYSVIQSSNYSKSQNYLTDVGAFSASKSAYGTFDQGGNAWEWNDLTGASSSSRGVRGGHWSTYTLLLPPSYTLSGAPSSSLSGTFNPANEGPHSGFRLASPPERHVTLSIMVNSGSQSQSQAGYPTLSGSQALIKLGAGTLVLNQMNSLTGSTTVEQGTLQLAHAFALNASRVVPLFGGNVTLSSALQTTVGGLDPNAGGLINVGNGLMTVVSGLAVTDLVTALQTGRGDGTWNGASGITSSVAAAGDGSRSIGWLDHSDGSLSFGFAAVGDTNLDWLVDSLDLANFLATGKFDTGSSATWQEGDFNYDSILDVLDVACFLSTGLFDTGFYNGSGSAAIAVPEPSTTAMALAGLACGGYSMFCRRRAS